MDGDFEVVGGDRGGVLIRLAVRQLVDLRQTCLGAGAIWRPRLFFALRKGFCGRPESEVTDILSRYQ